MRTTLISFLSLGLLFAPSPESKASEAGWSGDLLREVLKGEGRAAQAGGPETARDKGTKVREIQSGLSGRAGETGGKSPVILKTYQLQHLRLGDNLRAQTTLQLLNKLLPKEATLRADTVTNSLHLLASPAAHSAVWDFLTSMDVKGSGESASSSELSPQLQKVLQEIERSKEGSARLSTEISELRRSVDQITRQKPEAVPQGTMRPQQWWLLGGGGAGLALVGGLLLRRSRKPRVMALTAAEQEQDMRLADTRPALHELLGSTKGLSVQQKQLHQEMLEAINAASIRMEAIYNEQDESSRRMSMILANQEQALVAAQSAMTETKERLLAENSAMLGRAHARFELTANKLETGIDRLGQQNEKVEALVTELHNTVSELDHTKDEMMALQAVLDRKSSELDETRHSLSTREQELTKEQAKLAALTLILEEGYHLRVPETNTYRSPSQQSEPPQDTDSNKPTPEAKAKDNKTDGHEAKTEPSDPKYPCNETMPGRTYQFLPPDHPET